MKAFLTEHPALYVAILGMISTLIARFAAKLGIPLSDTAALHAAVIVGLFFMGFIGYLAAHAHGQSIGDGLLNAAEAGFEDAEPEIEKDAPGLAKDVIAAATGASAPAPSAPPASTVPPPS